MPSSAEVLCFFFSMLLLPSGAFRTLQRLRLARAAPRCYLSSPPDSLLSHPAAAGLLRDGDSSRGCGGCCGASPSSSAARSKLARRHLPLFNTSSLIDRIGRAVCETGVVPRKELFECFATATHIHTHWQRHYPEVRRVVDCCSGHGLLSWMLLLLHDEAEEATATATASATAIPPVTALCVDVRMPRSAEVIEDAMHAAFPALAEKEEHVRWSYAEAPLEAVEPSPCCLLAAVHACGGLSDEVVAKAIAGAAPLALVPCCHTLRPSKGYRPHPLAHEAGSEAAAAQAAELVASGRVPGLAAAVDGLRVAALRRAGFAVSEEQLPQEFTEKNRLILGVAPTVAGSAAAAAAAEREKEVVTAAQRTRPLRMRRLGDGEGRGAATTTTLRLPTADDPASIAVCVAASGRAAAAARKAPPPPSFDVSCWLATPPSTGLTAERLEAMGNEVAAAAATCRVTVVDSYSRPADGRKAQTFRIVYERHRAGDSSGGGGGGGGGADGPLAVFERGDAMRLHGRVVDLLPTRFPGTEVRC